MGSVLDVREPVWWIVDYKTSHAGAADLTVAAEAEAFLSIHREQHAGQLAAYAQVLRGLRESADPSGDRIKIRTGIYYPRLRLFDFWEA